MGPDHLPDSARLVLIVEDDKDMRACLRDIFEYAGYRVVEARTGHEGLQLLHRLAVIPDIIVTDLFHHGIDGFQFLQAVREKPAWREIPFIIVSAAVDELRTMQATVKLQHVVYLAKPFKVRALLDAVHYLAHTRSA
jgi:CheY-like chemotaxis protein